MTVKDVDATSTNSDEVATAEPTFDRRGLMVLGAGGLLAAVLQSARPAAAQSETSPALGAARFYRGS